MRSRTIMSGWMKLVVVFVVAAAWGVVGPVPCDAQVSLLSNGGFETGSPGSWTNAQPWRSNNSTYGALVGAGDAQEGTNIVRMYAFGTASRYLDQRVPATAGTVYEMDAYLRTPAGANAFVPTNGYATVLLQFLNSAGVKIAGAGLFASGNAEAPPMGAGGPSSWTRYTTGPVVAPAGTVTTRAYCIYIHNGDATTSGWVEFDAVRAYTTTATKAGALLNPDFETQPFGVLTNVQYWTPFGDAGAVVTNAKRSGRTSMQIWWQNNWMGQTWPATAGTRYKTQGYLMTPSSERLRGTTNSAIKALVVLEFFNSSGAKIGDGFASTGLLTNSTPDVWTLQAAEGVAPVGTVTGRTMIGILGTDDGFGGTVFFDDLSQSVVSSGTTTNGLLLNYGFDDGATGDAFFLSNSLPRWTWYGGSNAGFVVSDVSRDGGQSLTIVWPNNLAGQDFTARTGLTYVAEGYVMTPSASRMTSETAYATILLEMFNNVGGVQTSVSAVSTLNLTKDTPADTWVKLSVTNRAPWVGTWVTGRVSCALLDDANGAGFGGQVYFDTLKVSVTTVAVANTQSGALWNPGFEYTARGTKLSFLDNWRAFGDAGGVGDAHVRNGSHAIQIYWQNNWVGQDWAATAGQKYKTEGYVYTPSGNPLNAPTNAAVEALVALLFLDTNGTVIGEGFASSGLDSSSAKDTWLLQSAEGWAPAGTVTARTFVGISGTDDGFTGEVWFDDLSQSAVSSGTTTNGLLLNYGFDDGPTGDAFFLSNSLPRWTWYGGSNAGFVVSDVAHSNGQSLTIVWPNNLAGQDFTARTGLTYVAEGYVMTPSANRMTSETAYATILLEMFNNVGGVQTSVSAVSTLNLTKDTPADTWVKLSVTNRAPWVGTWVTGRVSCALLDDANGAGFGGQVYFDTLKVSVTTVAVANTQSGALWNPGFEYTARGTKLSFLDNWRAFGDAGGVGDAHVRNGSHAIQIYWQNNWVGQDWPATAGQKYKTEGYAYTPSGNPLNAPTNAAVEALVALLFLDTNGTVIGEGFASSGLDSSSAKDTWLLQSAEGWAPAGTVTARTFVGISGTDDGFTGEVWFDDLSQLQVIVNPTTNGVLLNPSFEDGPTGNTFDLYEGSLLPAWIWGGGDNAGFIGTEYAHHASQGLVITYPQNSMYQDFTVSSVGQTGNLLLNPGFEIGAAGGATPTDWFKGGELGQYNWAYESGSNGVAFHAWTAGNWGFLGQDVSVNADDGTVFTFSIRGLAQTNYSSSTSETYIKMEFWVDGEGSYRYAVTNDVYDALVADPNNWNTYTLVHTNSDSDVNKVKVLFGYGNATDTGGDQAAKWDNASLVQSVDLTQSKTYIASGYLYTPSSAKFNTDGSSWGEIVLSFYVDGSSDPASEFTMRSAPFGADRPADQWVYFCVTGQAPAEAVVTGRLTCTIFSADPGGDFDLGGVIWFDDLSVVQSGSQGGVTPFTQWQLQNFGSTTGPKTAPNEDYDDDGFINWSEFIAGTQPTNAGSYLETTVLPQSSGQYLVSWPSTAGRYYTVYRSTNLVTGTLGAIASGIAATPTLNVYTDAVPSAVQSYYYQVSVTTNHP